MGIESNLKRKVAIITGAGRGIGKAIALALAQEGADLVINDIVDHEMNRIKGEVERMGRSSIVCKADVSIKRDVDYLIDVTVKEFGQIDILVNNAGIAIVKPVTELTEEEWNRVLGVNLTGVFLCSQAAGQEMIKRKKGKIINIASILGKVALPKRAPYCTTKAGVIALTKVLAIEWAPYNIEVNAIAPAYVKTPLVQMALDEHIISEEDIIKRTPKGRLAFPEEIADVVKFLASDRSNYITGQTIYVDGGLLAYGGW